MTISGRTMSDRFFYFPFSFIFPLPPWGTISPRLIHKLHLAAVSPLPEETTLPSCGRPSTKETPGRMPDSPALRIFIRPPRAYARPERVQHGRGHPIPSLPLPMSEVRAVRLSRALPPDADLSAVMYRRRPFSPHLPDLSPVILRPPHCTRASRDAPFGTFPFHRVPSENEFPVLKRRLKKIFSPDIPTKNKLADRRRLSSKSPAAQAMSDVAAKRPPQKRTQNIEEYPRVKK